MQINEFSKANRTRCEAPEGFNHKIEDWSLSDWLTATVGELGEAANIIKKINRHRDGIFEPIPIQQLRADLREELADAHIYLDLMIQAAGADPETVVIEKFNKTSANRGYPARLNRAGVVDRKSA